MGTMGKTVTGIVVGLLVIAAIGVVSVVGIYNTCVGHEASIKAQYTENQNNYDKLFKTVAETAQVPTAYAKDLESLYTSTTKTRYGQGGSKAVFQFIKEHNPTLDSSLYKQVQQVIESGRIDFEAKQASLIDRKRVYESTVLNTAVTGGVAKVLGFPRIELAKFDIVTSATTDTAFSTKKAEPFKLMTGSK
jgi:hypothetical protein